MLLIDSGQHSLALPGGDKEGAATGDSELAACVTATLGSDAVGFVSCFLASG